MKHLCVVLLLCCLRLSVQKSRPEDDHYVAAVVEYKGSSFRTEQTLMNYTNLIKEAAEQGADIVVFPEHTLTFYLTTFKVPIYGALRQHPVPALRPDLFDEFMVSISAAARENDIYVVINGREQLDCTSPDANSTDGEYCPSSKEYTFDTNVIFNRVGAVIDRYRKMYSFHFERAQPALRPDLGEFTTDFGVTFGHFIGFDILFQVPAVQVVQKRHVKNVIYPTMWSSELPFLTVLVPQKDIEAVIRRLPQLHDNEYWQTKLAGTEHKEYLALPDGKDTEQKILYKIYEYDELKDSSDFTMDDWIRQARDIKKFYHDYDGFVVLHGTDTTAYGASILSFMLESVGKTVVLTGAQVPIFQPRSDGNNNLLCAILVAATQHIPEVTVFFGARLFRGTRVKKVSNTKIYAFDSPNFPALLEAKTTLEVDPKMLIHPAGSVPNECRLHDQLCRKVYILKVAPTITPELIRAVFSGMEGVVLETYGNGNIPIKRKEIYKEIETAVKNKVLVVNVTQCINGTVIAKPLYETGLLLLECGVVPAYDMTAEAAWAKLSYVLTKKELSYEEKVKLMKTNIRGEML